MGSKVKYVNFAIPQSVVNIFTEISHADRVTINKNISNVIFDRRPVSDPLGGLRGWGQNVKIQLFWNMVRLHIKLNRIKNAETW